jgi:hypothetical protein
MQKIAVVALALLSTVAQAAEPPFPPGPNQEWQPQPVRIICVAGEKVVLEAPLAWVLLEGEAGKERTFKEFVDPEGHTIAIGISMLATNCAVQRLKE